MQNGDVNETVMKKTTKKARLFPKRKAGIPEDSDAPYWKGHRAEHMVAARTIENNENKTASARKRAAKRAAKLGQSVGAAGVVEPRVTTLTQKLRRLERALARRKTLAAQQRVAQQIKDLKKQIASNG